MTRPRRTPRPRPVPVRVVVEPAVRYSHGPASADRPAMERLADVLVEILAEEKVP